jgi:hypothetical protein
MIHTVVVQVNGKPSASSARRAGGQRRVASTKTRGHRRRGLQLLPEEEEGDYYPLGKAGMLLPLSKGPLAGGPLGKGGLPPGDSIEVPVNEDVVVDNGSPGADSPTGTPEGEDSNGNGNPGYNIDGDTGSGSPTPEVVTITHSPTSAPVAIDAHDDPGDGEVSGGVDGNGNGTTPVDTTQDQTGTSETGNSGGVGGVNGNGTTPADTTQDQTGTSETGNSGETEDPVLPLLSVPGAASKCNVTIRLFSLYMKILMLSPLFFSNHLISFNSNRCMREQPCCRNDLCGLEVCCGD